MVCVFIYVFAILYLIFNVFVTKIGGNTPKMRHQNKNTFQKEDVLKIQTSLILVLVIN